LDFENLDKNQRLSKALNRHERRLEGSPCQTPLNASISKFDNAFEYDSDIIASETLQTGAGCQIGAPLRGNRAKE
jgi:hypothetical protein